MKREKLRLKNESGLNALPITTCKNTIMAKK